MKHDPYQIIIMRPTGGKPIMTIRSYLARAIIIFFVMVVIALMIITLALVHTHRKGQGLKRRVALQQEEIKDLNIRLAHKDEEIIALKKKIAPKAVPTTRRSQKEKVLPKIYPPIVEITEISLQDHFLSFKVVNIHSGTDSPAIGYFFVVFKKDKLFVAYPEVKLINGLPQYPGLGMAFTIRNFKPIRLRIPKIAWEWRTLTFYIFDSDGKLRLVMPVNRREILQ
ncbi:MAG: hypothetical protein J7L53_03320 [Deltaproteobacteria bacterium]|nr:hypothetical protein [Deltaproteobacteria bacterium]